MMNYPLNPGFITPHGSDSEDPKLLTGAVRLGEPAKAEEYTVGHEGQPQEACSIKEHLPADLWSEWPKKL